MLRETGIITGMVQDEAQKPQRKPSESSEGNRILYPKWSLGRALARPQRDRDIKNQYPPQNGVETVVDGLQAVNLNTSESGISSIDETNLLNSTAAELWNETRRSFPEELLSAFDNPSLVVRIKLSDRPIWSYDEDKICSGFSELLRIVQEAGQATPCRYELVPFTDEEGREKRGAYIVQAYPLYIDEDEVLEGERFFICEVKIFKKKIENDAVRADESQDDERETVETETVEEEPEEAAPEGESIHITTSGLALRQYLLREMAFSTAWGIEESIAKTRSAAENSIHIPVEDKNYRFSIRNVDEVFSILYGNNTYPSEVSSAEVMPAWIRVILESIVSKPEEFQYLDDLNYLRPDRQIVRTLLARIEVPEGTETHINFVDLHKFLPVYAVPERKILVTFGNKLVVLSTQRELEDYFRTILKGSPAENMHLGGLQFDAIRINNVEDQITKGRNTANGKKEFSLAAPLRITKFQQLNGDSVEKTVQKIADENKESVTSIDQRDERIEQHVLRIVEKHLNGVKTIADFNQRSELVEGYFTSLIESTTDMSKQIASVLEVPEFYVTQANLTPEQINDIRESTVGTTYAVIDAELEEQRKRILNIQIANTVIADLKTNTEIRGLIEQHARGFLQFKKKSNAETTINSFDALADDIAIELQAWIGGMKDEYLRLSGETIDYNGFVRLLHQYQLNPLYANENEYVEIDTYLHTPIKNAGRLPFGTDIAKFTQLKAKHAEQDALIAQMKAKPQLSATELVDVMYARARRGIGGVTFRSEEVIKKDFIVLLKLRDKIARSVKQQIQNYLENKLGEKIGLVDKKKLTDLFCTQLISTLQRLEPILAGVDLEEPEEQDDNVSGELSEEQIQRLREYVLQQANPSGRN